MKIVMIGASGFVGTRLINLLSECEGYDCRNVDLLPSHFFNDITVIGDVRDQEQMDRELAGADLVVLLPRSIAMTSLRCRSITIQNVGGMEVTLKAMEKNGVKRLIFFSSVAIYGLNKSVLTSPIRPILSITMASRNGRQNRWPENGMNPIPTGTSILCVPQ